MKNAIAILLAILMLSVSMKDLVIYAAFKSSQDYLTDNFCLNRFTPEELCFASCVLTATIQDSQENQDLPSILLDNYQLILGPIDLEKTDNLVDLAYQKLPPSLNAVWVATPFLDDIFQPPEV